MIKKEKKAPAWPSKNITRYTQIHMCALLYIGIGLWLTTFFGLIDFDLNYSKLLRVMAYVPIISYSLVVFNDETYKPCKWNIVGRFLKHIFYKVNNGN